MRWSRGHTSGIEDRRSQGATGGTFGGGMGGIPIPMSVGGGGGLLIVVAIIVLNLLSSGGSGGGGGGLGGVLGQLGGAGVAEPGGTADLSNNGDEVEFMGYVLDDANSLWADTFQRAGKPYQPTTLVLFTGGTMSDCGPASVGDGPVLLPAPTARSTSTSTSSRSSGSASAPRGDFARPTSSPTRSGTTCRSCPDRRRSARRGGAGPSPQRAVGKLELQADCFAGVWGHSVYKEGDLEAGDIDEALRPRPPSATTGSRPGGAWRSTPRPGRTDRPSSARPG